MILAALNQLYERLLNDPESNVSPPGYSKAKVSFALILSEEGELLRLLDLRHADKKPRPREMDVPRQTKRSVNVEANFLCDHGGYLLGVDDKGKPERTQKTFEASRDIHLRLMQPVADPGAAAVCRFFEGWDPALAANHPALKPFWDDLKAGGNLVFRLAGTEGFIHERPAIRAAWEDSLGAKSSESLGQCLVSGKVGPIARLHDSIKGVAGAQSSGAALVSFNLDAFTSYGKTQNFNAPVGERVAFGYVTALNYLLRSEKHRIRLGEATTVFWAERSGPEEDLLAELLDPAVETRNADHTPHHDSQTTARVRDILARLASGRSVREALVGADPDVRFFILGLSPNASRLSVRFWLTDSFGSFVERIARHYADLEVALPEWENGLFPVWRILRETAALGDSKNIPPLLEGAIMRAILMGTQYPLAIYTAMLSRIRADLKVNPVRAAVIKACLVRKARIHGDTGKGELIAVNLNEHSTDQAYLLGRLFALLEKAQEDATPGLNATIRDRYFGAASATPMTVFPVLLRLAQHHLAKAEFGRMTDRRIEEVMGGLQGFPAHLSLEEQGRFVLGYYQQRQALYQKKAAEA
ncbi:MAG: type I-C CRISPR-associated protein Cas8c/Csd1 [Chitinophagales bacterium]